LLRAGVRINIGNQHVARAKKSLWPKIWRFCGWSSRPIGSRAWNAPLQPADITSRSAPTWSAQASDLSYWYRWLNP